MVIAVYKCESGCKTYLHHDENGTYSAFVGKLGGDLRTWKTREGANKTLEAKGWEKINERKEA